MATPRAFGILNNQNFVQGNQPFGKSIPSSKSGETRPSSFALKDLTNKKQRTAVHQDALGKTQKGPTKSSLKAKTTTILQQLGKDFTKPAAPRKAQAYNGCEDRFKPQTAEYAWSQASCLRDDLLDQMLDFPDVTIEKKPLPAPSAQSDLLDLPDFEVGWDYYETAPPKPLELLVDDFPLVDIPDLEFMF
ncbi:AGAP009682-PA-like protein [Anopheles sinensis]|uniref:AGAP009682-PA-like protein n=1 Tax=Anopheles sinensis TaxID=74873 RepID=A0A084VH36_ANOSI|nr:AGAP009682-PA-like protein [Anopheles sinensis]